MRAAILGATGFIGGLVARAAVRQAWHVRAIRRTPGRTGAIGDLDVEWVDADLEDEASLIRVLRGCDVLFHAAATYPQDFRHVDREVAGAQAEMRSVLSAARTTGVGRVVYTSSLTTLGSAPPGALADETLFYAPGSVRSAYFEAKHAMEQIALHHAHGMDVVVLLPSAVFGPGDVKPTTGVVIRDAARGRFPFCFDAVINAVDGRDVAQSHIAAAESGRCGERYILGGHNLALCDLLTTVCRIAGRRPPLLRLPRWLVGAAVAAADHLPGVTLPENFRTFRCWQPVSSRKAEKELGHRARPFEETVRDTLAWFRGEAV